MNPCPIASPPSAPASPSAGDSLSTISTSTTSTAPAPRSEQQRSPTPHHWKPNNERLATLMTEAKALAEVRHSELQAKKALCKSTKADSRKRKRTLDKRAQSSLRSAEICREKFQIYPRLLERELQTEEQTYLKLISRSFELTGKIVRLNQQVADAERRADERRAAPPAPAPPAGLGVLSLPVPPADECFVNGTEEEPLAPAALDDFWSDYDGSDHTDVCGTDEPSTPMEDDAPGVKIEALLVDEKEHEKCTPTSILDASTLGVPDMLTLPESVLSFHG